VAKELARYKLDLLGVQKVRWEDVGSRGLYYLLGKRTWKSSIKDRDFCRPENRNNI
jgi:hypothetical protein